MKIAILIFLIINALLVASFVCCYLYRILESKTKAMKRNGALESENEALASQCEIYIRRLEDYKAKMPLRAKYRLGEKVICVVKDKVIKGIVRAVILYENEVAEYQVEVINNKDKTMSNTITILEGYVYPGNTLDVGGKNDK